mmetsp:Transcript_10617/g.19057  ORF Transcript_10617/g.19057 Transcript_10617/m.19057 type:complete len:416 (-) Transcript_10617:135-1382(-)
MLNSSPTYDTQNMFARSILSLAVAVGFFISSANAVASIDIGPRAGYGYTMLPGSSVETPDDGWQVSGSGSDIWGHWDEFHYLHFNRTTDVTVTCLVKSFGPTTLESWRKGGIMIRNKTPGIDEQRMAMSMLQVTGWGVAQQSRLEDNSYSVSNHDHFDTENVWLRMVKVGNTVTSYVKRDGNFDYMRFGEEEVQFGPEFYVGLAVSSHERTLLATLDVKHFEISDEIYTQPGIPTEIGETGQRVSVQQVKEGIWSVQAGGAGIGGTADSFGFFGSEHTGNINATLHLESLLRNNNDSKGGLMMRASTDPDAAHVSLVVKAGDGVTMYYRAQAGGETTAIKNVGVWRDNIELSLVKNGDSVEASYKHKAAPTWYVLGTANVPLGATYLVGHAVTSADTTQHGQLMAGAVLGGTTYV